MSYTNTTPNYDLPLYLGTDKPTYESDWNSAMSNIDSAIANASAGGEGVQHAIEVANAAQTTANQANVTAQAAQSTANSAAKLTVTTVDPGEGAALPSNTILAIVEA